MSFVVGYLRLPELPEKWFLGHRNARACLVAYRRRAKEIGYDDLASVFDAALLRVETLHPRPGYVVGRPVGGDFGMLYGLHWMGYHYFLTDTAGLQKFEPDHADVYWRPW
jgi:hypothetical protein